MTSMCAARMAIVVVAVTAGMILADRTDDESANWKAPTREAAKKNPIPVDEKSLARGKSVYSHNCFVCHGRAGRGDGPKAFDLEPKPRDLSSPEVAGQADGALYWKISEGRRPMPSFRDLLSDEDRWYVVNYIHTFRSNGQPQNGN